MSLSPRILLNCLLCATFFFGVYQAHSQPAPLFIQWQQSLGGDDQEYFQDIVRADDGGWVVGGSSSSQVAGNKTNAVFGEHFWVAKVDKDGNKLWDKAMPHTEYGGDRLNDLRKTSDGGYVFVGGGGNENDVIVKLDSDGNELWRDSVGWALVGVQETSDGGFVLLAGSRILKLNVAREIVWDKSLGISGTRIRGTSDGGFIVGGYSTNLHDLGVEKLDANGNTSWQKTFGGDGAEECQRVHQTSDGGYIIAAFSNSGISGNKTSPNLGDLDYWIVKLDVNGNKVWDKSFGSTNADSPGSIEQVSDGGYICGGFSSGGISGNKTVASYGTGDIWVIKLDASGNKLWEQAFGGNDHDGGRIYPSGDGGYVIGGLSLSGISGNKTAPDFGGADYWILKLGIEPPLKISWSAENIMLSWPTNGLGFVLQSASSLSPPGNWTNHAETPSVLGLDFVLTNSVFGENRFYRLRK